MTIAAGSPDLPDVPGAGERYEIGRWTISLAVVLALHIALAVHLISRPIGLEPAASPPAAVMIDLPARVAAPPPIPQPAPPPPEPPPPPQVVQPEPPPPVPLPDEPPPPPPLPPPPHAVALPKPPPPPPKPPKPRPVIERPVQQPLPLPPMVRPPQPIQAPAPAPAPAPAAPSPAAAASAKANWQSQLAAALARNKRYPRAAQEQHQQGVAALSFVIDRNGRVLGASIARSSGFPLLDEEVLALIQRAQPLPPAPPEVVGNQFSMTVPISFTISR